MQMLYQNIQIRIWYVCFIFSRKPKAKSFAEQVWTFLKDDQNRGHAQVPGEQMLFNNLFQVVAK